MSWKCSCPGRPLQHLPEYWTPLKSCLSEYLSLHSIYVQQFYYSIFHTVLHHMNTLKTPEIIERPSEHFTIWTTNHKEDQCLAAGDFHARVTFTYTFHWWGMATACMCACTVCFISWDDDPITHLFASVCVRLCPSFPHVLMHMDLKPSSTPTPYLSRHLQVLTETDQCFSVFRSCRGKTVVTQWTSSLNIPPAVVCVRDRRQMRPCHLSVNSTLL